MNKSLTKTRIVDAAERLFAERGYEGASLRAICAAANANSASVHYYFESKEDLVSATISRRMNGLAERRNQMLDELLSTDKPPTVHAIVETMVLPLVELVASEGDTGRNYIKMLASLSNERPDIERDAFHKHNLENLKRQYEAFSSVLPDVPPDILRMRLAIASTVFLHWLARPYQFGPDNSDESADMNQPEHVEQLLDFLARGIGS